MKWTPSAGPLDGKGYSHLRRRHLRKTSERPGLATLLNYASLGDIVCVVRLGRLGRLVSRQLFAYAEL
jgi:DNA invertase Pin-like site-specific DNA recombinase